MATLSKPLSPHLLIRDRQIVTRFQKLAIRHNFPFLDLPPELRNNIYDFCLNFNGVESFFDKYYGKLKDTQHPEKVRPPRRRKKTPTILLINRQIFAEAVGLLKTKPLNFHHGLLDIKGLNYIVCEPILAKVTQINITTKGHPLLQKNILKESWSGYMELLKSLAESLSKGHQLQKLTINFDDEGLVMHTTSCWNSTINCDFRDQVKESFGSLRSIRGVGSVTITGIPPAFAQELKTRMESKPINFLDLPGEIRNQIYGYAADPSDISTQVTRTMEAWKDKTQAPPYPPKTTPTIFLLNRQIYKEAKDIIHQKPLKLVLPFDKTMQKQDLVPNMVRFISQPTLQNLNHIDITIESWEWVYSLDRVVPTLAAKHNLKSLHFNFKDTLKNTFVDQHKNYPDHTLHTSLSGLAQIRGVKKVTFSGDLPKVYSDPLKEIMQSPSFFMVLPALQIVRGDGTVVNADREYG